jgi:hypothetical protein
MPDGQQRRVDPICCADRPRPDRVRLGIARPGSGVHSAGVRRLFLSEDAGIQKILKDKAAAGARVRILLGGPLHLAVAR